MKNPRVKSPLKKSLVIVGATAALLATALPAQAQVTTPSQAASPSHVAPDARLIINPPWLPVHPPCPRPAPPGWMVPLYEPTYCDIIPGPPVGPIYVIP